ncbi:hypothetical protein [Oscillatoria acuminata]|nr:hypothetical protein [Oscillatoria acuminata]
MEQEFSNEAIQGKRAIGQSLGRISWGGISPRLMEKKWEDWMMKC